MLTCYYNLRIVRKYIMFNGSVQHLHLHHKSDLNICKSDPNANIIYLFHRKGCKFFIQASTCQSNKDEQHLCVSINLCQIKHVNMSAVAQRKTVMMCIKKFRNGNSLNCKIYCNHKMNGNMEYSHLKQTRQIYRFSCLYCIQQHIF